MVWPQQIDQPTKPYNQTGGKMKHLPKILLLIALALTMISAEVVQSKEIQQNMIQQTKMMTQQDLAQNVGGLPAWICKLSEFICDVIYGSEWCKYIRIICIIF
jgi:hypothetical protein